MILWAFGLSVAGSVSPAANCCCQEIAAVSAINTRQRTQNSRRVLIWHELLLFKTEYNLYSGIVKIKDVFFSGEIECVSVANDTLREPELSI